MYILSINTKFFQEKMQRITAPTERSCNPAITNANVDLRFYL